MPNDGILLSPTKYCTAQPPSKRLHLALSQRSWVVESYTGPRQPVFLETNSTELRDIDYGTSDPSVPRQNDSASEQVIALFFWISNGLEQSWPTHHI